MVLLQLRFRKFNRTKYTTEHVGLKSCLNVKFTLAQFIHHVKFL